MATNEELSIAFLCLATRQQQSELMEYMNSKYPDFMKSMNGAIFEQAIILPHSEISRKIAKLGSSLYEFPQKNSVHLWMADKLAAISSGFREPTTFIRRKESAVMEANDHVMPVNLGPVRKEEQ